VRETNMYANARIVQKLLERRTAGWDEAYEADYAFDSGEYSGPAWTGKWKREMDECVSVVADRLGIPEPLLAREYVDYVCATGYECFKMTL
jgi:hypothetical protein